MSVILDSERHARTHASTVLSPNPFLHTVEICMLHCSHGPWLRGLDRWCRNLTRTNVQTSQPSEDPNPVVRLITHSMNGVLLYVVLLLIPFARVLISAVPWQSPRMLAPAFPNILSQAQSIRESSTSGNPQQRLCKPRTTHKPRDIQRSIDWSYASHTKPDLIYSIHLRL